MRILIVEDEKKVAQFLQKGFQAESFTVDVAADGHTGLRLAQTESYDAIILDVMLPGKNGFEILTALRASKIATPVLMLSAKSDIEDRVEG
jgi:DNA-binding response OmpR family regulator